ncbi:FAD-dependent oxidoreductase [Marispirochaeta sp.]|uniref:FAD-dependent oxidoreductase n=1 Tax=Marispirochaeta sp. TaxID=2038653 RepID=UPI0029C601A0|nr:FAD-dependent oxidoreductase [Marispirochaeta sp.]
MQKLLIIGGVAAGATAAARARRIDAKAEITVLEAGPDVSFANCGLPYYIGGDIDSRSKLILQSPESFKSQYNVTVITETEVQSIDRRNKLVSALHIPSGKQEEYSYDSLILAQGGKPLVPPLRGVKLDHVFSLWTLQDMDAIDDFIRYRKPENAVVVGGGFIGLEMIEALRKRGLNVSVVERMPHVMPTMEPEIAGFLQEELLSFGVGVYTSKSVEEISSSQVLLDDGSRLNADMVLMSVGVRPTLKLASDAGLELGDAGGLLVDRNLRTSDPHIFAAGDMIEIEHKINGAKVRIPLAGPANRQGRIAANNALGIPKEYSGSQGTSIVRVFEAVAGSTGLNLNQARQAGFRAEAVTVHKEHHTSYYPGARQVTVMVIYDRETGRILGGQTAGLAGADRRLDVLATAAAAGMRVHELSELDLAYSPPLGSANDAINMAAFAAENRISGYSPAITAAELDQFTGRHKPAFIDVRDYFAFERSHVSGADHVPLTHLEQRMGSIHRDRPVIVYDETGKKAHQALRQLVQAGFDEVYNLSGGFTSLERHARALGFSHLHVPLLQPEEKSLEDEHEAEEQVPEQGSGGALTGGGLLVIDVRTPEEFAYGAYPDSVNIPLDELGYRAEEISDKDREVIVYCASGARSAYAARMLTQMGFSDVKNGGGLMDMMENLA